MLRVSSIQTLAGISLFVVGALTSPSAAAPEKDSKDAKPAAAAPAAGAGKQPAATGDGTPPPAPGTPEPGAEATVGAIKAACKKAVADLGTSGVAALKPLDDVQRTHLVGRIEATRVLTCLAIANDNKTLCDPLPDPDKGTCGDWVVLARDLKKLPKGQEKAFLIHQLCVTDGMDKVECATARDAMAARDATRCGELKHPSLSNFCTAIASGDPAKCGGLKGDERAQCEAYASDDPARCPKESPDCQQITRTFKAVKAEGLAGAKDIDPAVVAIRQGKPACTPLLAALEKASCSEVRGAAE